MISSITCTGIGKGEISFHDMHKIQTRSVVGAKIPIHNSNSCETNHSSLLPDSGPMPTAPRSGTMDCKRL